MGLYSTLTADYIADLRKQKGKSGLLAYILNYSTPLDNGGGEFYWDSISTEADDNALTIKVNKVDIGRWKRKVDDGLLSITWFGGKSDCDSSFKPEFTDNAPIFTKVDLVVKNNPQYVGVLFPKPLKPQAGMGYLFKSPMAVRHSSHVVGYKSGANVFKVPLYFNECKGIQLFGASPQGGIGATYLENFDVIGIHSEVYLPYVKNQDGIYIENKSTLNNISVTYFKGYGIRLSANVSGIYGPDGDIYYGTNANNAKFTDIICNFNAGVGLGVEGGDANVIVGININVTKNGMWGLRDKSLLGCTWINIQASDNAIYGGEKYNTRAVYVAKGGMVTLSDSSGNNYYFLCKKIHTNQKPIINQETEYWSTNVYPIWDSTIFYGGRTTVLYNNKYYYSNNQENNPNINKRPDAGLIIPGSSTLYWVPTTDVGRNVLFDYSPWSSTTQYKQVNYWAAWDDSVNQDPELGGPWINMGGFNQWNLALTWSPTLQCYGGGGYCALSTVNKSLFLGCYTENGEPHNIFQGATIDLGGFNQTAAGSISGSANGNGLNMYQLYIQGGATDGIQIRGTNGSGFYPLFREIGANQYGNHPGFNNIDEAFRYLFNRTVNNLNT